MDRALELPALVLLDEVGGGTDPIEGGALGAAVVDHFRRRGAIVVATTHDDALKSYAATTEGVEAAAFGFNPETYAPTYRLMYGAPGRSLALEIAERLGMPAERDRRRARAAVRPRVAARRAPRARRHGAGGASSRRSSARSPSATRWRAERRALLEREARLTEREAVLKQRLDDKLNEQLREARAEVDAVVTRLKSKADALADAAERRARREHPSSRPARSASFAPRRAPRSAPSARQSPAVTRPTANAEALDRAAGDRPDRVRDDVRRRRHRAQRVGQPHRGRGPRQAHARQARRAAAQRAQGPGPKETRGTDAGPDRAA